MAGELLDRIRKAIGKAIPGAGLTRAGTLASKAVGSRTPGALTSGPAITPTNKTFQGFFDDNVTRFFAGTQLKIRERMVVMIGDTIEDAVEPKPDDEITLEGVTGRIIRVASDPAKATFACIIHT